MSEQHREPSAEAIEAGRDDPAEEKTHIWDKPRNVKRLLWTLYGICALLFVVDFFVHRHVEHPIERIWGFYAIYGWAAAITLVLLAKQMRKVVMRREDYYDAD